MPDTGLANWCRTQSPEAKSKKEMIESTPYQKKILF